MRSRKLFFFLIGVGLLFSSCVKRESIDFVRVEGDHFEIAQDTFFPLMLNYLVSYQSNGNHFIVTPSVTYDDGSYSDIRGSDDAHHRMQEHFCLIKNLGFNTIRVCIDRVKRDDDGRYYYQADRKFYLDRKKDRRAILKGLDNLVQIAEEQGLRVMLLIAPPFKENNDLQQFTIDLLEHFKKCPALFAYDFMNEPLYFDPAPKRAKENAVSIVSQWKQLMDKHAPDQLFTIGFAEPIEAFEWDCTMAPVDFVEFHTYHPLRVPSEIYWYSNYCRKPWMIGETGLPADNDSITYDEQAQFVREAYQLTRDAGGCGFGLWEFQDYDTPGNTYEASYTGIMSHGGFTHFTTQNEKHTVKGTLKPVAHVIANLEKNYVPRKYERPSNYYNMMGYNNICIHGQLIDTLTEMPIEGAVIRGWNDNWSVGMNTYSNENGYFTLYCNDRCNHFEISALGYSKIKFDRNITYIPLTKTAGDIQNLKGKELEYHQISYHPFVKKEIPDTCFFQILNFEPELFNEYDWEGQLGILKLERMTVKP